MREAECGHTRGRWGRGDKDSDYPDRQILFRGAGSRSEHLGNDEKVRKGSSVGVGAGPPGTASKRTLRHRGMLFSSHRWLLWRGHEA